MNFHSFSKIAYFHIPVTLYVGQNAYFSFVLFELHICSMSKCGFWSGKGEIVGFLFKIVQIVPVIVRV